jgi:hypothetical protein
MESVGDIQVPQDPKALRRHVDVRFREAFGPPINSNGSSDQWSLTLPPPHAPINVVLEARGGRTAYWIFDPHAPEHVVQGSITSVEQVDAAIRQINERVARAENLG